MPEFSLNDRYLIEEYYKHNEQKYLLAKVVGQVFVIPYKYLKSARTSEEAVDKFKDALLDFQLEEKEKYLRHNEIPLTINIKDTEYVLPRNVGSQFTLKDFEDRLKRKALTKYNAAINAHRKLNKLHKEKNLVDVSAAAIERYTYRLGQLGVAAGLAAETPDHLEILEFFSKCKKIGNKKFAKFHTDMQKLATKLAQKVVKNEYYALKSYRPKHWKISVFAGATVLLLTSYMGQNDVKDESINKSDFNRIARFIKKTVSMGIEQTRKSTLNKTPYVDFTGEEHKDPYGNLALMKDIKPEIMAVIVALEGYSDNAFLEGGKTPTMGSGFTFVYDEKGMQHKVKMGDKTTPEQDVIHNERYIDKEFTQVFGECAEHKLTKNQILATIGAGYCWGTSGLLDSKYFEAVRKNMPIYEQQRRFSGYRKQKGLIKREYMLAQILEGNWTAKDVLDLPIYYNQDYNAYLECSIYGLNLHDCVPCEKKGDGNYKIGSDGHECLSIKADGFCENFFHDKSKKVLQELINSASKSQRKYKTVRDFLPNEMVEQIEKNARTVDFLLAEKQGLAQRRL